MRPQLSSCSPLPAETSAKLKAIYKVRHVLNISIPKILCVIFQHLCNGYHECCDSFGLLPLAAQAEGTRFKRAPAGVISLKRFHKFRILRPRVRTWFKMP